ncbi:amino acid adenylation domain-containing protein [Dolichospermum sp. ST_con]|nr:amino acid adenylation domain-containing protein [Dolichospermum sp. ST_con]MDD1419714.1 amino acid adenylation domain-containing protein [Dolichospermum sp. ST_sed1]MDD1422970.1 amino acid adenylation domain-containing protein [Dolichospermum sp. ST_sed9]MDD1431909.1 amino acid adenylation domain-containing protein [Dolichospermum sp. ST_sed6]MDD1441227.1 amino acid adenylation domain-containing protein [Dolichospermum sp. ST_sed3]MDD1447083.1 amino acid adenylation domain-containing prote
MNITQNQQVVSLMLRLQNMGCRIWAEDDKLRIRTSKNALSSELKQEIQDRKADILTFLKAAKTQAVITAEIPALSADSPKLLSFAQQRLWLLAQLQGLSATYNMPIALQLNGNLNIDVLHSSLAYLLNRHESLRMYFPTVAGQPQVAIRSLDEIAVLTVQDCRKLGSGNKGELDLDTQCPNIQDLIDAHAQEHFDLNTGPLFKAKLLQLEEQKSVLAINMHHIISDGWSMGVFLRELWQVYTAYSQDKTPNFAPLPIQYSDYAAWQRHWLQGEVLAKQIDYWKHQLGDASPLLELPTDYPRPAQQSYRGQRYIYALTPELTTTVNAFSQQQGVSLYMTVLATLSILLSRYSRQNDLCIGSPIANRTHSQTEGLIGFFVNTLVMRQQIKPEQSFIEFLQQTRQICLDAYAHQDVAFDVLVEKLHPERSMSYNPLFQVMLVLENNQSPDLDLSGLEMEFLGVKCAIAKFDLTLLITESDHQLNCSWEYATDLFARDTIQRMAEQFAVLLKGIIDHPHQSINTLPLMTATELLQIQRWNQTQTDYPQDKTFVDLFAEQVAKNPDNLAVVFESENLTYQQLNEKAEQLADYLIENYQIQPDTLIGISVERSLEMIIGVLGILKAGGAYVPIDPNYPPERIKFMLEDSRISVLLTQSFVVDKLPLDSLENPVEVVYLDDSSRQDAKTQRRKERQISKNQVKSNNLAYVIYTSGSTGKPKGVMIEHRGLVNLILAVDEILQIQPQSRVLQFANFSFDASIWEIAPTLSAGACLYLTRKENLLPSQEFIDFLTKHKITHVTIPPSVLSLLPQATLPDLQILITAGEACPKELVTRWAKGRSFFNGYGPTESTVCASIALCQPNGQKPLIGKPLSNLRIYILDAHHQPLPTDIPGELCIAGVGLARGYFNRPELTAQKFMEVELFGQVERIYKTGDLARWGIDGNLEYLGRIDEQVKLRGFRIELGEIESLLLQHPLVNEAVVILYQTESNQSLIAYVTGIDHDFSSDLKKYLKSSLPDYMIPAQIVVLEKLPLTPNGKIDRKALPAPNVGVAGLYTAPRNEVEAQLLQLWSAVLERQEISIHDNFFDLGGHSLLVIKLLNLMQEMFGQKLTLSSLFQNPTIAQLAEQLGNKEVQKAHPDLLLIQSQGNANPLFCVPGANGHGLYFQDLAINLENHPVYSLETPGRNGIDKVPKSVEIHAIQLIDLLHHQQPQGPYILTGYSSGCAVAFEMACQLEKRGEKVELLAILDAGLVTHPEYLTKRTDIDWIWQLLQRIEAVKGVSLGLEYADLAAQSDEQARWDLAAEFLYKKNVLPEYSSLDLLKTNMQVMKQLTINYANYRPSHQISAPIVLFRAEEVYEVVLQEIRAISNYDLPDWGWQPYTENPVKVISVPGNHGRMLYEPNVKTLASHLRVVMT